MGALLHMDGMQGNLTRLEASCSCFHKPDGQRSEYTGSFEVLRKRKLRR